MVLFRKGRIASSFSSRNLKEVGCELPWVLDKLEKTPAKKNRVRQKVAKTVGPDGVTTTEVVEEVVPFASAHLPDEEEEDDREYDPAEDPDAATEEDDDADDSVATSSVAAGTPNAATPGGSAAEVGTPK